MKSKKEAVAQAKFCKELMDRLSKSVEENAADNEEYYYYYYGMKNHTQMNNDIIRLRRELNTLSKMVSGE